jgi:hypothetical protein
MGFFDFLNPNKKAEDAGRAALEDGHRRAQEEERRKAEIEKKRQELLGQKKATIQEAYGRINSAPGPKEMALEALPTGALPQFDLMRQRAQREISQKGNADAQGTQDIMRRRLAASGSLQSGAGIKALQTAQETASQKTQEQLQSAREGIDSQEAQQRTQLEESTKGRNLQREQFNEEQRFRDRMFRADTFAKFQDLERQVESMDLSQLQVKLQQEESLFNQKLARWQASNTGGLFGGGGFLGTGIGAPSFQG